MFNILVAVLVLVLVVIVGIAISKRNEGDPQPSGSQNSQVGSQGSEIEEPTGTDTETEPESESESETESEIAPPEPQGDGSELFVMFGVDSRSDKLGKGTRSDSIMLISVNHDAKQVKVVSIYRDCMLYQNYDGKEKGYKKISNAHSYYGPEGAISVLNENLDLNIENYCTVNFNALINNFT